MKNYIAIILSLIFITIFLYSQDEQYKKIEIQYDSLLAQKLGADAHGMKKYVMAFLKTGPIKIEDKNKRAELHKGHMQNIIKLSNEGKLIIAGPFYAGDTLRGLFLFNVETIEEAEELAKSDPAVSAGIFQLEFHLWYGSAALLQIPELHKKLEKKSIGD